MGGRKGSNKEEGGDKKKGREGARKGIKEKRETEYQNTKGVIREKVNVERWLHQPGFVFSETVF